MRYRPLGSTGMQVSEIGFGGEWLTKPDADATGTLIDHAEAQGINIIDCWMSDPLVRSSLGDALQGRRDRWIIQGHLGSTWQEGPLNPATYQGPRDDLTAGTAVKGQYVRTRRLSCVQNAFEDLLRRLHTDYIDLGMIHFVDSATEYDAIMQGSPFLDYVLRLRQEGTIRAIGMSTHNPLIALKAARSGIIESIMFSANPAFDLLPASEDISQLFDTEHAYHQDLQRIEPVRAELYATCEQLNIGLTIMKPYAGGRLLDASASVFGCALTPVQCLHYCLTRPGTASVLAGYRTVSELEAACAYEQASESERNYAAVLADAPQHAFTGACTYCGHCAPCPAGISIADVNKYYDLATMQSEIPPTVQAHYEALPVHADACIACHACERRCPFGVPVAQRMRQAAELFG